MESESLTVTVPQLFAKKLTLFLDSVILSYSPRLRFLEHRNNRFETLNIDTVDPRTCKTGSDLTGRLSFFHFFRMCA